MELLDSLTHALLDIVEFATRENQCDAIFAK